MTTRPHEPERSPYDDGTRKAEFSNFYRNSFGSLVARCVWIGVPAEDAAGIVQDLMLEIYRRWPDIGSPEAYARTTVPLRAVGFLRISASTWTMDGADLASKGRPLTSGMPDAIMAIGERQVVLQALGQLPPTQRAVFALDYDGFTSADIGAILGMKESTVRSNLRYAKKALRAWWAQAHPSGEERSQP
jgi:RNA polymerase sigma factor (sigma-70 family)